MTSSALPASAFAALLAGTALSGCATKPFTPPVIVYDDAPIETAAVLTPEPEPRIEVVALPEPLPLPGQLQPLETPSRPPESPDPSVRIADAHREARIEPSQDGFINAMQVYPWTEGALYQVYAAPGQVTDITLQPGERLVGAGPVAAGDTVRWIIGDTTSGVGATGQVHILVKPTRPDLSTNLVINTDRRTYHLELHATEQTWMASVSWIYPQDRLIALRGQSMAARDAAPVAEAVDVTRLNFRYAIEGDQPPWRPLRAFDDGLQVYIQFPGGIGQGEMPPLFILGREGGAELVNYRVRGDHMVVDRLFAAAELRLGEAPQSRVRIVRSDGRIRR